MGEERPICRLQWNEEMDDEMRISQTVKIQQRLEKEGHRQVNVSTE